MGRSIPTDEPTVLYPSLIADTSMRFKGSGRLTLLS
jgi:hypothetical protein